MSTPILATKLYIPSLRQLLVRLEHLPPQMHLVIPTREDPNLPLARYRVQGHLTELRAADLEILAFLERGNLFVVPLDDVRQWYRYHHLFADVLRVRLTKEQPNVGDDGLCYRASVLHQRASVWYEENGLRCNPPRLCC